MRRGDIPFELGVVKDALVIALDEDLKSGVDEFFGGGWGQR